MENASQEPPFPRRALSHCRSFGPRSSALCLCLSGPPWAPAQSRSREEGAFAPLSRRPPGPGAAPEPPAPVPSSVGWVSGTQGDRPIPAPPAYLPVPTDGLVAGALRPSFSLSLPPRPSSRAGWAPPPPLPDRLPARPLSNRPAAWRVGHSAAARLGAEAARRGGEREGCGEWRV